jgi:hypothetical protein
MDSQCGQSRLCSAHRRVLRFVLGNPVLRRYLRPRAPDPNASRSDADLQSHSHLRAGSICALVSAAPPISFTFFFAAFPLPFAFFVSVSFPPSFNPSTLPLFFARVRDMFSTTKILLAGLAASAGLGQVAAITYVSWRPE